jgi:prepilin-type N-terminal cleavage/methylation domain-containing protein
MKYNTTTQSGFTLVETLVAITILLVVLVGPMTISSKAAQSSSFSSEQVTAFFLAQEGLEIVQKARDDLLVRSFATDATVADRAAWAAFTDAGNSGTYRFCYELYTATAGGCGLEMISRASGPAPTSDIRTPVDCGTATQATCNIRFDFSNVRSKFTHTSAGGSVTTPYNRRIFLTLISPNEVAVRSVVTWQSGNARQRQRVEVESRLFNTYGN